MLTGKQKSELRGIAQTCAITANEAAVTISAATHSEVVQVIGRTFTLYRRSKKNKLGL